MSICRPGSFHPWVAVTLLFALGLAGAGTSIAETPEQAISRIQAGRHTPMPPPSTAPASGPAGKGMTIENGTGQILHVHFSGPVSRTVVVPDGRSESVELAVGDYQVAAEIPRSSIMPFYGRQAYQLFTHYWLKFYTQRVLQVPSQTSPHPVPKSEALPATRVVEAAAETPEEAISRIQTGSHTPMPPLSPTPALRPAGKGINIENVSGHTLQLHFSGPVSRTIAVSPRSTQGVELPDGDYHVAAEAAGSSVVPIFGRHVYKPHTAYRLKFSAPLGGQKAGSPLRAEAAELVIGLPDYVLIDADKAKVVAHLGQPTKTTSIPIQKTEFSWDYIYFEDRDLLFESIGDRVFAVSMGQKSRARVLGIAIGDEEKKVVQSFPGAKKTPEIIGFFQATMFPVTLRRDPSTASDVLVRIGRDESSKCLNFDFLTVSDDLSWVRAKCEKVGEGWMPIFQTNRAKDIRNRYLEYLHETGNLDIRYRIRGGRVTMIWVFSSPVRYRNVGMVMSMGSPRFDLEHYAEK